VIDHHQGQPLLAELGEESGDVLDLPAGEPGERFVDQEEVGIGRERPGEFEPEEPGVGELARR
jgi:hypothetical protein